MHYREETCVVFLLVQNDWKLIELSSWQSFGLKTGHCEWGIPSSLPDKVALTIPARWLYYDHLFSTVLVWLLAEYTRIIYKNNAYVCAYMCFLLDFWQSFQGLYLCDCLSYGQGRGVSCGEGGRLGLKQISESFVKRWQLCGSYNSTFLGSKLLWVLVSMVLEVRLHRKCQFSSCSDIQ